jgi:hypothetical protein
MAAEYGQRQRHADSQASVVGLHTRGHAPGSDDAARMARDRLAWVELMLMELRRLPLQQRDAFFADHRNYWAAEACLRRALDALFELAGLSLQLSDGVTRQRAELLPGLLSGYMLEPAYQAGVQSLLDFQAELADLDAGLQPQRLYDICVSQLATVDHLAARLRDWLEQHGHLDGQR